MSKKTFEDKLIELANRESDRGLVLDTARWARRETLKELSDTKNADVIGMVKHEIGKAFDTDSITELQHEWMIASGAIGFKLGTAFKNGQLQACLSREAALKNSNDPTTRN